MRERAGLPGHFLDDQTLRQQFGIDREAALLSPDAADADPLCPATPAKTQFLLAGLRGLLPDAEPCAESAWSGVFGTTADGLPLIGPVPGHPRVLAAYGYGGNGITFGFFAAELIAGVIGGRRAAWYDDFPLGRPLPSALK